MAETDPMTVDERRKYLHKIRLRYWAAQTKKERSRLLDEAQAVINLHRKSLIRLLNGELARKRRTRQRGKTYGAEVEAAIHLIARSLDYPCAERLKPNLVWMAKHLQAHGELQVSEPDAGLAGTDQRLQPAAAFAGFATSSPAHCPSARQSGADRWLESPDPDAAHGLGRTRAGAL